VFGKLEAKERKKMEGVDYLAHERATAQFDVESMKVVWAGSKHELDVSDRMARIVASDPVIIVFLFFFQICFNFVIKCGRIFFLHVRSF
jgi:hypothetical protein